MRKIAKWGGLGAGIAAIATGGVALMGWVLMLTVGAMFHEFGILRPVGFWPSVGIAAGLMVLFSMFNGGRHGN